MPKKITLEVVTHILSKTELDNMPHGTDWVPEGTIRDDGKPGEKLDHGIAGWPFKNCQCDNCTYWRKRGQGK